MISATADDGCKKLFSVYIQFVYFVSLRLGTYNTLHPAKAAGFAGGLCPLSTDTKLHRTGLNSKNMSFSRCSSHPGRTWVILCWLVFDSFQRQRAFAEKILKTDVLIITLKSNHYCML